MGRAGICQPTARRATRAAAAARFRSVWCAASTRAPSGVQLRRGRATKRRRPRLPGQCRSSLPRALACLSLQLLSLFVVERRHRQHCWQQPGRLPSGVQPRHAAERRSTHGSPRAHRPAQAAFCRVEVRARLPSSAQHPHSCRHRRNTRTGPRSALASVPAGCGVRGHVDWGAWEEWIEPLSKNGSVVESVDGGQRQALTRTLQARSGPIIK